MITSINNFRDMGGVQTADGKTVKKGLLYRSGHLGDVTAADIEQLKQLGIKLVFDYRDDDENNNYPSPHIEGIEMLRVPAITEDNVMKVGSLKDHLNPEGLTKMVENFAKFYTELPFENPSYQALMKQFVDGNTALLHHCTAGKDRTGVGAALMYLMLGVPERTIIDEYLLTNEANKEMPKWYTDLTATVGELPQLKVLVGVSEELIQPVFDVILEKYGSYDKYFAAEFNIGPEEIQKVRQYYLQ